MRDTDAELDFVRRKLEWMAAQRLQGPLSADEERDYEELLARELQLLDETRAQHRRQD